VKTTKVIRGSKEASWIKQRGRHGGKFLPARCQGETFSDMMLRDKKSLGVVYLNDKIILDRKYSSIDHGYSQSRLTIAQIW
jgi:hypothetical protein